MHRYWLLAIHLIICSVVSAQESSGHTIQRPEPIRLSSGEGTEMWSEDLPIDVACDAFVSEHNPCSRFWASAEYLYWHERGMRTPVLVTSSSAGTARNQAGVLGQSTTSVLLGNDRLVNDGQSGGRFAVGGWLDKNVPDVGLDLIYTTLGRQSESFSAASDEFAILARPFLNVSSGREDARLLGFPNSISGSLQVRGTTSYEVYEALIRRPLSLEPVTPTYIVYGYRHAELDDAIRISDSSLSLSGPTSGTTVSSVDEFRSQNTFDGFEAGMLVDFNVSSCWQLSLAGKVAFGETRRVDTIAGQSTTRNPLGSSNSIGGLLAQRTNIGRYVSSSHGVLQDFGCTFRRYLQQGVSMNVGYSIHRWTEVSRAGDQIDRMINPTQVAPSTLVGDARPARREASSDFIAQGITAGLEYIW